MTRLLLLLLTLLTTPASADPSVTVAFSPGGSTEAVVQVIGEAKHSIHVAAYGFTSKPIAAALIAAHRRGVLVQAVLDKSNATARYSAATFLSHAGIATRINHRYAIMHDRFIVVDGVTVQTGSFNYTKAAGERNAENLLILRDHPNVASRYEQEWQRLWDESRDYPSGEAP